MSGKQRRLQFVECPNDISGMIVAAKFADIALLLIDGSYGFKMGRGGQIESMLCRLVVMGGDGDGGLVENESLVEAYICGGGGGRRWLGSVFWRRRCRVVFWGRKRRVVCGEGDGVFVVEVLRSGF
ncbi:hypothetical protein IFM89_034236 [Coptis chinensis]|uniref:Uncharacterized protein n=1 Tax=Coptis chinensis TaxID=261450 RepID=A0A835H883_9MAGN|nr:hypothetical protein IFM89_034236 [Coptis chinensis]